MPASIGSFGSATPNARPTIFSYWPTAPKLRPSNVGDATGSTTSRVILESPVRGARVVLSPDGAGVVVAVHAMSETARKTIARRIDTSLPRKRLDSQSKRRPAAAGACLGAGQPAISGRSPHARAHTSTESKPQEWTNPLIRTRGGAIVPPVAGWADRTTLLGRNGCRRPCRT